jgi:uncharacterized protein DUF3866
MLTLRRGRVVEVGAGLVVEVDGERRGAWADEQAVGPCAVGDDVVVNVQARDLGLGSGGFDIVHVNLSRGLAGEGTAGAHVMKLNYSSLQHAVLAVEEEEGKGTTGGAVGVFFLHGQLAPICWALGARARGARAVYVQTAGGALPGSLSRVVRDLRERGLLADHVTAGPSYGGEHEAITTAGAIDHALRAGADVVLCGPGPGILGSASRLGHGGLVALDSAHAALALGHRTVVVPRMSAGDPRERHRGFSHHARTVLELLLAPAVVALPAGQRPPPEAQHHTVRSAAVDLEGYRRSGLPARTMGRELEEDPLFFAAALAGGRVLADMIRAS